MDPPASASRPSAAALGSASNASDEDDDNEISFLVKFLGRVEAARPGGLQTLSEAAESLKVGPGPGSVHLRSHVLVSAVGDAFKVSRKQDIRGGRDLIVEALRHKFNSISIFSQNKMLQRENAELKRRLAAQTH
ncbi:hypothetical protein EYF80_052264 [Liparis tanakae]|uniref:Uncharacterized protein n=1 Tax=Liparis tanakae TaxID=230148 RepID=A0A4Z2F9B6_9TELE|nr:hypothetical protein EYF80_052264 [Liparis tanakae]